ncbi:hypothetical protein SAMN04488595_10839 [Ralstonia sp. 25mfcol4.1]|uniref:hypothetical protein n=1 Tax=Burkholderiaceae TaxID=119060 RepID=UPI00088C189B|nr:hypothetical protein [Ralstonia sp. 25mfcol4.1]SDP38436.1 hypothetical protein SAMN04488595_10839 [Ralstonia sp. 25mfcol4.1]
MRAPLVAVALWLAAIGAQAQEVAVTPPAPAADTPPPAWSFLATGFWNMPRHEDSYASGIFGADHGQLHLEARVNYEARHAQSGFVGWSFSGGETFQYKVTPIVGVVVGSAHGPIAGVEASLAVSKFDYYIEAEYLPGTGSTTPYTYAWSELGFRPVQWLRVGLVAQRTRIYGGDREFQRGGLVQLTFGKVTGSVYWFNPASHDQVVIAAMTLAF